jgi:GTP-binding protein
MLLHVVSLAEEDPVNSYYTIRDELSQYDKTLADKEEWIILTKKDLAKQEDIEKVESALAKTENRVLVVGQNEEEGYKNLRDTLVSHLRDTYNT